MVLVLPWSGQELSKHAVNSLFQEVPRLWIDTTARSLSCFLFLIPFPLPVSINMTSGAA